MLLLMDLIEVLVFDGKLDELRLWLNTGSAEAISDFASKANVGLTPNQFVSQDYATEVNLEFAPSADFFSSLVEI